MDAIKRIRFSLAVRFLRKIKRATHRSPPALVVPKGTRVLVVAPHMDDEVISSGGTLWVLREAGAELHVVWVSDGSAGGRDAKLRASIAATRAAEAAQVSNYLQVSSAACLSFPDGELHKYEPAIVDRLTLRISQLEPDLIFCPFPCDGHSDHMSCARATGVAAMRAQSRSSVYAYEVWTPLWPNVAVDITQVAEKKIRAIRLYRSQINDRDYAAAALGLNQFRGLPHGVAFAEAFFKSEPADFEKLTRLLDTI